MKLHPRTLPVQKAGAELSSLMLDWIQKHDLTCGEIIGELADQMAKYAKYMRRTERHGENSDKRGDEA